MGLADGSKGDAPAVDRAVEVDRAAGRVADLVVGSSGGGPGGRCWIANACKTAVEFIPENYAKGASVFSGGGSMLGHGAYYESDLSMAPWRSMERLFSLSNNPCYPVVRFTRNCLSFPGRSIRGAAAAVFFFRAAAFGVIAAHAYRVDPGAGAHVGLFMRRAVFELADGRPLEGFPEIHHGVRFRRASIQH